MRKDQLWVFCVVKLLCFTEVLHLNISRKFIQNFHLRELKIINQILSEIKQDEREVDERNGTTSSAGAGRRLSLLLARKVSSTPTSLLLGTSTTAATLESFAASSFHR